MDASLQSRVAELPRHHSIDLGDGVITPGGKSSAICAGEASLIFDRVDLSGRSVLDIGAWNGFFSFEAKRRGAARVSQLTPTAGHIRIFAGAKHSTLRARRLA